MIDHKAILLAAAKIIEERPKAKGAFVADVDGQVCYCMAGAILHAAGATDEQLYQEHIMLLPGYETLRSVRVRDFYDNASALFHFNDYSSKEVVAAKLRELAEVL